MTNDNIPTHDATRRPQSRFSAGAINTEKDPFVELPIDLPISMVDDKDQLEMFPHDPVQHPQHYTSHPSGIECIQITEHMGFCLGNAVKYIWRADLKGNSIEDLKKAVWYIEREIEKRSA